MARIPAVSGTQALATAGEALRIAFPAGRSSPAALSPSWTSGNGGSCNACRIARGVAARRDHVRQFRRPDALVRLPNDRVALEDFVNAD
jgi:hypothetical protein